MSVLESVSDHSTTKGTRSLSRNIAALSTLIGSTPLLAIHLRWKNQARTIYAKAEHYNLTGSIKDRMALFVLSEGARTGSLKPGDLVIEATSGNSGIATAAVARALGHRTRIFMPDWMSQERKQLLRSYGAELELVSAEDGGVVECMRRCEDLGRTHADIFGPCQFTNPDNWRAHAQTTGPEILAQLGHIGLLPDAFVAGVGTGGTVMGCAHALRATNSRIKIHPVEPAESPTLSVGRKIGSHRIQGMTDDFIPEILDLSHLDNVIAVSDGDAILMAQKLASKLGVGVGISSGANLIGALKAQDQLCPEAIVATVFSDDNKKYLSTAFSQTEPIKSGYLTPDIELISFDAIACPNIGPQLASSSPYQTH